MPALLRTTLSWLIVVALFVAAGYIFVRWDLPRMRQPASPVGQKARNVHLVRLDGSGTTLAAYAGHPLWLNFFATWCGPCKVELPEIQKRYLANRSRGLIVLGIDQEEQAPIVADFVRRMGLSFPILIDKGEGTLTYHVSAIPMSVFIDGGGAIRDRHLGQMLGRQMDEALKKILP